MLRTYLTRRALLDVDEIDAYSMEAWGVQVADQYLSDLQSAMERLGDLPDLLRRDEALSLRLRFYRVREHVLVCDIIESDIYVLAIRHTKMDLRRQVAQLEPQLVYEAELLHKRILGSRGR